MRIHTDTLTDLDIHEAMEISRTYTESGYAWHNSRSRTRAFNILLRGDSNRRPNSGNYDDYAATWDQWGVFLAVLFDRDPKMVTPYYKDAADFHCLTDWRFSDHKNEVAYATEPVYWPADAHGDHTFRWQGIAREQSCTKCSAVRRWTVSE